MFDLVKDFSVIGHRGWPTRFPENTLVGLLAAAEACGAVELDVRRSGDGKLVLAHDPILGGLEVSTSPWSELGEVDLGGGAKPCLLDEALSSLPAANVMIEIKNDPNTAGFEPDHRLGLEAADRARHGDMVTSFNWDTARAVARAFPDKSTGLIVGLLGDLSGAYRDAEDGGHDAVIAHIGLFGSGPRGEGVIPTYVWSGEEEYLDAYGRPELESFGVSGIITNDPGGTRQRLGIDE